MRITSILAALCAVALFYTPLAHSQRASDRIQILQVRDTGMGYSNAEVRCSDGSGGAFRYEQGMDRWSCAELVNRRILGPLLILDAARHQRTHEPRTGAVRISEHVVGNPPVRLSIFHLRGECFFAVTNSPRSRAYDIDEIRRLVREGGGAQTMAPNAQSVVAAIDGAPAPCNGAAMQRGRGFILGHGSPGILALYAAQEFRLRRGGWLNPIVFETPAEMTGNRTFYNVVYRGRPPEGIATMQEFYVSARSVTVGYEGLLSDILALSEPEAPQIAPYVEEAPQTASGALQAGSAQHRADGQRAGDDSIGASISDDAPWWAGQPIDMDRLRRWVGSDCVVVGDGRTGTTFIRGECRRMQLEPVNPVALGCTVANATDHARPFVEGDRNFGVMVMYCNARDPRGVVNDGPLNTNRACAITDWGDRVTCASG